MEMGKIVSRICPPKCCGQDGGGAVKVGGLDEKREREKREERNQERENT